MGLKNKENCRDTCTNTVSKPSVSVSSSNSSPHGHKSKESKRLGSSNKAGSAPNPAPTTDQTPLPYLSQITPNTSKEPIKKISKCNFTSRYKPNIRKMSANYKKSLNIYQNLAEIPSSFRHYVPVGSESSYQNFMNWGNSGYQAPRTAEDIRLRRVQGGFSGRVGSGKCRVGSADASKRDSTQEDSETGNGNSTNTIAGYNSAKYQKINRTGTTDLQYRFKVFKHPQQYIDDYKSQIVEPELMEYNEKLQNQKYEKYRQGQQMLKAIPLGLGFLNKKFQKKISKKKFFQIF